MIDVTNRVAVIKYIDAAIDSAYQIGYRLELGTNFVDSKNRTVCPMGAVQLCRKTPPFNKEWMVSFAQGFDGRNPQPCWNLKQLAYQLGLTYRRILINS